MPLSMGSFMPRLTSAQPDRVRRCLLVGLLALTSLWWFASANSWAQTPKTPQLKLSWRGGELLADVDTQWQAPAHIKQVLERGVPLVFLMRATVIQPRWYWRDKQLASLTRRTRVVYLPLTNQWRVSLADSEAVATAGNTDAFLLHQNVSSMPQAIALAANARGWALGRVADFAESTDTRVTITFALDTTALPRPFQIGVADQGDWGAPITLAAAMPPTDLPSTAAGNAPTLTAPKPAPVVTAEELNQRQGVSEGGQRP